MTLSLCPPANLHQHLERHEINYLQFSFRWFNNLLMREMPLGCTVRLWDTLHAEQDGFSHFVLYVCAAFLKHFSQNLMAQRDFQVSFETCETGIWYTVQCYHYCFFLAQKISHASEWLCLTPSLCVCVCVQGLMLLLQNLPTSNWSNSDISMLVAEAFRLKFIFADAPNHLQAAKKWGRAAGDQELLQSQRSLGCATPGTDDDAWLGSGQRYVVVGTIGSRRWSWGLTSKYCVLNVGMTRKCPGVVSQR